MLKALQTTLLFLCFIFTQNIQAQYCAASGGSTADEWIQSIAIGSFSYTSGNDGGYDNLTNQTINLSTGNNYNVTLNPGYSGTQYDEYWRIWIDLNDDDDFNDSGELVYSSGGGNVGTTTGSFSVPSGASIGTTRLRVAMKWVGETADGTFDNDPPNACGTFEYGEVEDYTVNIGGGGSGDNYCAANGGSTVDEWIQSINIDVFSNNSGNNNGYLNATNQTININNVSPGITLTPGYSDTQYDEYWRIWIDFNKDNDFTDANELVFGNSNAGTITGNLTLPANTNVVGARMRVAMKWIGETADGTIDNDPPNACGTFEYGEVEDYTVNVNIGGGTNVPVANFNSNVTSGNAPLTVSFSDNSTNNPTAWSWNFPGGSPASSNAQNPTVVYNTPGTYSVILTASNSAGGDVENKTGYITVFDNTPTAPVANFSSNVTSGTAPLTVNLMDLSSNNPTSWFWSLSGGTPSSANTQNPSVVYNTPGTYAISLTASNSAGSNIETKNAYITVTASGNVAPVANFSSNITSGDAPLTVNFFDVSSNNPTAWSWNFPGGSPASATVQNPTVIYNTPGTYQVTLTATNSFGSDVETKTGYITVGNQGGGVAPVAAFSASIFQGNAPLVVTFFDQSVNNPQTWSWEMPGAAPDISNLKNPTVTYNNQGTFPVTLTVTNTAGSDSETESMYITVLQPVSVENPENNGAVLIAPNPTDGFIRVTMQHTLSKIKSANIYNNLGQMIKTLPLENNTDQWEFDISELPGGMYMLHLNIEHENYTYPILKK